MVSTAAARRGWGLHGCLFALCVCWAVVFHGCLPALARAEGPPPSCPAPALEIPGEMAQPDREVRGLRNDLREACAALAARLDEAVAALSQVSASAKEGESLLDQVHGDLTSEPGLPVRILGQAGALQTEVAGGSVAVSNPTDVAGVQAAVRDNSETFVSNTWAIFGLVVGFGVLAVFWKLVRP